MGFEFEVWPPDVVSRLSRVAERLHSGGLSAPSRRAVLADVVAVYESHLDLDVDVNELGRYVEASFGHLYGQDEARTPRSVVATAVGSGSHQVFAACLDTDGTIWTSSIGLTGPDEWIPMPHCRADLSRIAAATCVSAAGDRHLREIFGITRDGRPWHSWQMGDGQWENDSPADAWELQADSPQDLRLVAAASGGTDHVEVFVADAWGELHHRWWLRWWDSEAGAWAQAWSRWTPMDWSEPDVEVRGLSFTAEAFPSETTRYHLFITDQDGQPWHRPFVGEPGQWWLPSARLPVPPMPLTAITGVCRTNGHLEVFGACQDGRRCSTWTADRGVTWAPWQQWTDEFIIQQADGATQDADDEFAVHHQLTIDASGGLFYTRFHQPDERWRGPFPALPARRGSGLPRSPFRAALGRFGLEVPLSAVRAEQSDTNRGRAFVETDQGELYLERSWLGLSDGSRFEALLCSLSTLADRLAHEESRTLLPTYLRTPTGEWTAREDHWCYSVRRWLEGRRVRPDREIETVARAAAHFHRAGKDIAAVDGLGVSVQDFIDSFSPLPLEEGAADLPASLRQALERLAAGPAAAIDQLPVTLTHTDLQPKNIVVTADGIGLIGLEYAALATPVSDLYYFLVGDDHGSQLGNWRYFERALSAYTQIRPLSGDERELMPSVFQVMAADVAGWAEQAVGSAPLANRGGLRDIHATALHAICFIELHKDRIRTAVR